MTKKHYEIHLTNREFFAVTYEQYQPIEGLILARSDERIKVGDRIFSARDVKYVRPVYPPDYQMQSDFEVSYLTDEERQANLARLEVLRGYFFGQSNGDDWINPYETGDIHAIMTREELRDFRAEFFDVYIRDHHTEARAMSYWLPFKRGQRDAGQYSREACIAASRPKTA